MKALSILQPWAWAIVHGTKRIENRTWSTKYRGPLALLAGKSPRLLAGSQPTDWHVPLPGLPDFDSLAFGAIVGICRLVECVPVSVYRDRRPAYAEGPWCWILRDVAALAKPIPWKGEQGLFEVPDSVFTVEELERVGVYAEVPSQK